MEKGSKIKTNAKKTSAGNTNQFHIFSLLKFICFSNRCSGKAIYSKCSYSIGSGKALTIN